MLHSVGSNVYTSLHRTVNNPSCHFYAFTPVLIFDACCIMAAMRWEIILPEAVLVGSESIRSGIVL